MITLVTLTFNNFDELMATVNSLKGAEGFQHLIVNGGTCEKTKAFLQTYPHPSITERDQGISDGFNKGLRHAKTEYVGYLNSGDLLTDPNYFVKALQAFEDPDVHFVHGGVRLLHPQYGPLLLKPRGALPYMPFNHPLFIARKECFERIGGFSLDFKVAMDFDWMVRLMRAGFKGKHIPSMAVEMDGCGVSSKQELKGLLEREKSIATHFSGLKKLVYLTKMKEFKTKLVIKNTLNHWGFSGLVQKLVK